MSAYLLTPIAEQDLSDLLDFIASESSIDTALKVEVAFRDEFIKLAELPGMGHYREELLSRQYRFSSIYSYVIVYRWETVPIQIVAILHGTRNLNALLRRRIR
jgi:plasmid stabilization system protein ParE